MKQRGQFEAESADFLLRFLPSRNGKYLCGQFAGKKINRHLQMMVTSAISMVLCCSMFLGTTMAWFTDSIISGGNQITIGTLAVDVLYKGRSLNPAKGEGNYAKYVFEPNIVWSPNHYEIRELTVVNSGNLPITYVLSLMPSITEIAKHFDVYVLQELDSDTPLQGVLTPELQEAWGEPIGTLSEVSCIHTADLPACINQEEVTNKVIIALCMKTDIAEDEVQSFFGANFDLFVRLTAFQDTIDYDTMNAMHDEQYEDDLEDIAAREAEKKKQEAARQESEESTRTSFKLTKPSGSTTSKTGSETVSETTPETTPETVPETTPETTYETTPETVPETTSETTPETTSEAAGQNLDDADSDPVPPTTAEAVPDDSGSGEDTQ